MIERLLKLKATNVNAKDKDGITTLMLAVSLGEVELFDMFVKNAGKRLDFSVVDNNGFGVVSYSVGDELREKVGDEVISRMQR